MTLERAIEINTAICGVQFRQMGIIDTPQPSLKDISLRDMLDAVDMVSAESDKANIPDGKTRTIHMTPDPRLVAAVYCIEHYKHHVSSFGEKQDIVIALDNAVLMVVHKSCFNTEEDEE